MDQASRLRNIFQQKVNKTATNTVFSSRVITVTSGKGGVGKSNTTVNLAIQLTKLGKRVVILDADLGLANVELLLGVVPKYSLVDVMNGTRTIEEILTPGPMGIKFISGGSGVKELVRVSDAQLNFFLQNLKQLDSMADVILVDTGAGLSNSVMSFVKAVEEVIVVTTPEPTAITDAYSLIKVLKNETNSLPKINLIINRVEDEKEGLEIFEKLEKVSNKFLQVNLNYLGSVPFDTYLVKAVKKQEPVVNLFPKSISAKAFENIGNKLMDIEISDRKGITSFIKKLVATFNA